MVNWKINLGGQWELNLRVIVSSVRFSMRISIVQDLRTSFEKPSQTKTMADLVQPNITFCYQWAAFETRKGSSLISRRVCCGASSALVRSPTCFSSPCWRECSAGKMMIAGTMYRRAGWAALKMCITAIVVPRPTMYPTNVLQRDNVQGSFWLLEAASGPFCIHTCTTNAGRGDLAAKSNQCSSSGCQIERKT